MLPKSSAIEAAIRGGVRRVHVISYAAPDALLAEVFTNEGTGTLVVADTKALSPAEQGARLMTRLWDKGAPLDERVLRFTAGEDHALDDRLVAYDVRASIAHAEMLHDARPARRRRPRGDPRRAARDRRGARARRVDRDARPRGRPDRARDAAHARIGAAGARLHAGRSRNDQVLVGAAALPARRRRVARRRTRAASPRRSRRWPSSRATSCCPATRTCSRRCRARSRCGRAASPPRSRDDVDGLRHAHRRITEEPARLGRRLRHAEPADRSRRHARAARLRRRTTSRSPRCSSRAARPRPRCCSRSRC